MPLNMKSEQSHGDKGDTRYSQQPQIDISSQYESDPAE